MGAFLSTKRLFTALFRVLVCSAAQARVVLSRAAAAIDRPQRPPKREQRQKQKQERPEASDKDHVMRRQFGAPNNCARAANMQINSKFCLLGAAKRKRLLLVAVVVVVVAVRRRTREKSRRGRETKEQFSASCKAAQFLSSLCRGASIRFRAPPPPPPTGRARPARLAPPDRRRKKRATRFSATIKKRRKSSPWRGSRFVDLSTLAAAAAAAARPVASTCARKTSRNQLRVPEIDTRHLSCCRARREQRASLLSRTLRYVTNRRRTQRPFDRRKLGRPPPGRAAAAAAAANRPT